MHAYYDIENLNENHQALFWVEIPASHEANNFFLIREQFNKSHLVLEQLLKSQNWDGNFLTFLMKV